MSDVRLENVCKKYPGGVTAVCGLNLSIGSGEFALLAGPSGCGKSTLLKMIAGLEGITQGRISVGDRLLNGVAPKERDVAVVLRNHTLYPQLTVAENMSFGLKLRRMDKEEVARRVGEAAELLDLGSVLDKKPKALTSEQRQRVALGRAIVRNPRVILFDEPLSDLEPELRAQMWSVLKDLHSRLDATFIYATQDLSDAKALDVRVVVMKDGAIQQDAPSAEIFNAPASLFVATMCSPRMNALDAALTEEDGKTWLSFGQARVEFTEEEAKRSGALQYVGKDVILGVCPEDIHILEEGAASPAPALPAVAESVEPCGPGAVVWISCGGKQLAARAGEAEIKPEDPVKAVIDTGRILLFDRETEAAILRRA